MLLHHHPRLCIYFGDARDHLMKADYLNLPNEPLLELEPFSRLKKLMKIDQLTFLHQTHSDHGVVVANKAAVDLFMPFKYDGDYLITNAPTIGIGVMTADCLPIIMYDTFNNAVAVVHAGWKGSVANIGPKVLMRMQQEFGTDVADVTIFFGPSAKSCCYEVQENFLPNLEAFSFADQFVQQHGEQLMFDLPGFNRAILESAGIKKDAFHFDYNLCTICDSSFYSARRDGALGGRQMTVVALK